MISIDMRSLDDLNDIEAAIDQLHKVKSRLQREQELQQARDAFHHFTESFGTWLGGIANEVAKAAETISERHCAGAGENSPVTPIAISINDGPAIVAHTKDGDIAAVLAAQKRRSNIYSAQIVNAQG